jgi:hypothetical protein
MIGHHPEALASREDEGRVIANSDNLFSSAMVGPDPAIHVFVSQKQGVDHRDIGERKRRRSSNGYAR